MTERPRDDRREAAARYRAERAAAASPVESSADATHAAETPPSSPAVNARQRAAYVETAIAQAIRRGEFDNLPGAGKPLQNLGDHHDPDWWIRRKIQTENLTGLGPPALALRVEHARMDATLDALTREADVRETVEDFNRRVIEARRQLLGGPPVVTPTHDVDADVAAWTARRAQRDREAAARRAAEQAADAASARRRPWRHSPQQHD